MCLSEWLDLGWWCLSVISGLVFVNLSSSFSEEDGRICFGLPVSFSPSPLLFARKRVYPTLVSSQYIYFFFS